MLRNKTFAPEFCSLTSNWFDMREQAPGANLLHESVSGASSLVCTGWQWLRYLPGSVFRQRVSGASYLVCTVLQSNFCDEHPRDFHMKDPPFPPTERRLH